MTETYTVDLPLETVSELVRAHYRLDVAAVTLVGAETSTVCRVDGRDGSVVAVKIFWDDAATGEAVRWQHDVVSRLAAAEHPVARPLASAGGDLTAEDNIDGRPILLQASEWLSGTPLEEAPISSRLLREIGRTAAHLHHDLSTETAPRGLPVHDWELTRSRLTIEAAIERIGQRRNDSPSNDQHDEASTKRLVTLAERVCRTLRDSVEPRLPALPRAVGHHDLHDSNLLVGPALSPNTVVGILDFGDMHESARISEPIIAAAYAARNTAEPLTAVREVMAGWSESVPVTSEEASVVLPLVAARLTTNAVVWASRLGSSRGEYAEARLHGSIETAELLIDLSGE